MANTSNRAPAPPPPSFQQERRRLVNAKCSDSTPDQYAAVAPVDTQMLGPFRTAVEQVMSVPGIKNLSAQVIISEIGTNVSRFPSSWASICRRNEESAASILRAIYHMLKDGTLYQDLARKHFDRRSGDQQKRSLVKRLTDLGYTVELKRLAT